MAINIKWTAILPGYGHHLLAVDPAGTRLYSGDGWGSPSYASLSLRLIDMSDGRELYRLHTKYQQPRSITYRGPDLLVATDSRVFELSRSDLTIQRIWERRVPRFSDTLMLESDRLFMTNWLGPTAGILDLSTGRATRWLIEAGLRPLRRNSDLTVYSLRSGLLRRVDVATRSSEVVLRGVVGLSVALAANRWLAVLTGAWKPVQGGIEEPARETRELMVFDLKNGTARKKALTRDTVAVDAADTSPILWLSQRGPGVRVLPSIVERVDAESCQTVDKFDAPSGSDVVQVVPDQSVVFFGEPHYKEQHAAITCGTVS